MSLTHRKVLNDCLRMLLRPYARFCLRHSIKLQEVLEQMKAAMIEAAEEEMLASGDKINISRLGVMTGVHRPDVVRIYRDKDTKDSERGNFLTKIVGQWQSNTEFLTPAGRPKTLDFEGVENEFVQLVRSVSSDLNPYAILFEMERVGLVLRTRAGIKLQGEVYNPRGDMKGGFALLSGDVDDLVCSVEENLFESDVPNHHIKTTYDRISASSTGAIRRWLVKEGMNFHQRLRRYLSQHDLDLNPKLDQNGPVTRVAIGSFSRIGRLPSGPKSAPAEASQKKERKKKRRPVEKE